MKKKITIAVDEAKRILKEKDVREEEEYITGHARDAELLPVDELDAESAGLMIRSKETPVLVYCRTGRRSREAAQKLEELGYTLE